jgi:hypothetical protein
MITLSFLLPLGQNWMRLPSVFWTFFWKQLTHDSDRPAFCEPPWLNALLPMMAKQTNDPIAITPAAFEAIAATLPLGSVSFEAEANERGERLVWLERSARQARRPAEARRELQRRDLTAGRGRGAGVTEPKYVTIRPPRR